MLLSLEDRAFGDVGYFQHSLFLHGAYRRWCTRRASAAVLGWAEGPGDG
ncbi:MAG TPA: hypothetical protein VK540_19255 [Polyangiaceae bacterium]|nr:hypothetical protein [Polyangiaceae bacterium]